MNTPKLNVSLDKTVPIVCEKCENQTFSEAVILRKVSRFLTGQSVDGLVPIPIFCCTACGGINNDFLPQELQNKED